MAQPHPKPYAFWCRVSSAGNVGDQLTPWLIRRLTGHWPRFARPGSPVDKFMLVGSMLMHADRRTTVWGAGIMSSAEPVCAVAKFLAVRGPLSRRRALDCGADCPPTYGDPALLLPDLLPARVLRPSGVGIVAHFADKAVAFGRERIGTDVRLIDVQTPVEDFVAKVVQCELICSSSLHGLIIAQAYGVPVVWLRFAPLPSGDGVKFADYFLATGQEPGIPVHVGAGPLDPDRWVAAARPAPRREVAGLWASCPWPIDEIREVPMTSPQVLTSRVR